MKRTFPPGAGLPCLNCHDSVPHCQDLGEDTASFHRRSLVAECTRLRHRGIEFARRVIVIQPYSWYDGMGHRSGQANFPTFGSCCPSNRGGIPRPLSKSLHPRNLSRTLKSRETSQKLYCNLARCDTIIPPPSCEVPLLSMTRSSI